VVDHLPSTQTSVATNSDTSGVADVAFIGNRLYGLLGGAGCSHGDRGTFNGIFRVESGQHSGNKVVYIANLSHFIQTHPVANPEADDFEPDGTWYSMIALGGSLFAIEPNHGELDKITPLGDRDSSIRRIADISASQGHIVPTVVAFQDGAFYVGNLSIFPLQAGASKILKITRNGQVSTFLTGFTAILGLTFDQKGRLYVLETSTGNPFPTPGTGKLLRVTRLGTVQTLVTGLTLPTGMTFGPDGALYVSDFGIGTAHGEGKIVRISVHGGDDE
jgi:hypothetical protein